MPVLRPGPSTSGSRPNRRRTIARMPSVSAGTTEARIDACTDSTPIPRCASAWTRSTPYSSSVRPGSVARRTLCSSRLSVNRPNLMWVLPMSMARSNADSDLPASVAVRRLFHNLGRGALGASLVTTQDRRVVAVENDAEDDEGNPERRQVKQHGRPAVRLEEHARDERAEQDAQGVEGVVERGGAAVLRADDALEREAHRGDAREARAGDEDRDAHPEERVEEHEAEDHREPDRREHAHHREVAEPVADAPGVVREQEHAGREEGRDQDGLLFEDALGPHQEEGQKEHDAHLEVAVREGR